MLLGQGPQSPTDLQGLLKALSNQPSLSTVVLSLPDPGNNHRS